MTESSVSDQLERLARDAMDVAKTARRNNKSLSGDNFYSNKLATLRADAANVFRSLKSATAGDASAAAELIEMVFSAATERKARLKAFQELSHSLRTIWSCASIPQVDEGLFPLSILSQANRGYLVTVGRQMNGCFSSGWYDAAAVMMRRLLEIVIIEAFEALGIAAKIKDGSGNYLQLTDLIAASLSEPTMNLSRNSKKALPALRDVGHMSAHGRYFTAKKEDLEKTQSGCRVVVEELLHHARLL